MGKASTVDEAQLYEEYENLREAVEKLKGSIENVDSELEIKQEELEQIETELMELETAYKNAGGITKAERKKLTQEFEEAERIKAETTAKVKMFVER